jgi:type II secretion system protein L
MQLLVIRINELSSSPEYALLGKKQAQDRFTPGDWKRISSLTRGRRVLLLLPNEEVSLTSVNIPSKNKKQLQQAVPFALEDSLADDIEDLHFSVHQDSNSSHAQVAIINRATLTKHIEMLRSKGMTAHFVLPELLTQEYTKECWSLVYNKGSNGSNVSVRLAEYEGFSCDESMLDIFLTEQLEKQAPKIIYSNSEQHYLPKSLQNIPFEAIDSKLIQFKNTSDALELNLLTNFVAKNNKSVINWKAWRPVAVLGSLLVAVWMSVFFWQNNLLQQQSKQLNQQIEQIFKASFPKSRIVDPSVQMKSELDKLKQNTGQVIDSPLPLISDISPLLKQYKDLILSEVRFQENELSLIMQSPSLTRLETFKKDAAEKMKLKVDIKSSTTTSNKVEATLIVSPLANSTVKNPTFSSGLRVST